MKFGRPTQNDMPMTLESRNEEVQYGGRLFHEPGSSNISAVD